MEFSALYLKGLDTDLGTLKDSYRDIVKLHISDISSLNIKDRLKVKGVFAKVENLEDCPQEFLEFAKEHELPVILMKPSKQNNDTSQKLNKLK